MFWIHLLTSPIRSGIKFYNRALSVYPLFGFPICKAIKLPQIAPDYRVAGRFLHRKKQISTWTLCLRQFIHKDIHSCAWDVRLHSMRSLLGRGGEKRRDIGEVLKAQFQNSTNIARLQLDWTDILEPRGK